MPLRPLLMKWSLRISGPLGHVVGPERVDVDREPGHGRSRVRRRTVIVVLTIVGGCSGA